MHSCSEQGRGDCVAHVVQSRIRRKSRGLREALERSAEVVRLHRGAVAPFADEVEVVPGRADEEPAGRLLLAVLPEALQGAVGECHLSTRTLGLHIEEDELCAAVAGRSGTVVEP